MIVRTVILGACMLVAMGLIMAITRVAGEEDDVNVFIITSALGSLGAPITLYGLLN